MNAPNQTTPAKPEPLLRLPAVVALTGLGKTSIYQAAHAGTFPKPLKLSARCIAWRASDIAKWQAERLQALGGAKP